MIQLTVYVKARDESGRQGHARLRDLCEEDRWRYLEECLLRGGLAEGQQKEVPELPPYRTKPGFVFDRGENPV